ncbi:MinD/ParA family protein [Herbaspirillum sp. GCM10030257]|uniref:MinD/ParA family ATP-binding protein n=1 Tax=Herbaspirillum sp. GCM10030257 TaxID=3273393 RepID=UPI003606199A
MVSFNSDQAEGLRRILGGPKQRILTFLSATPPDEKGAMLVNLAASLKQSGRDVLLVDACCSATGIAAGLDAGAMDLLRASRHECTIDDAIHQMPQGFGITAMMPAGSGFPAADSHEMQGLSDAFDQLVTRADIIVVDTELRADDSFPISSLADSEIVVQVSTSPDSITSAYTLIKRVNSQLGKRPFSVLVTGASEKEAQVVYKNMAQAASRYLSVKLNSLGSVPADEHLTRASRLGRAVVDAFPLAGASVAFRRLAARFAPSEGPPPEFQGISPNGAKFGM